MCTSNKYLKKKRLPLPPRKEDGGGQFAPSIFLLIFQQSVIETSEHICYVHSVSV